MKRPALQRDFKIDGRKLCLLTEFCIGNLEVLIVYAGFGYYNFIVHYQSPEI